MHAHPALALASSETHVPVVAPTSADGVLDLLWLVIALPLAGATVLLLLGNRRTQAFGHWVGLATITGSFVLSLVSFLTLLGRDEGDR
ncbi:NADH-quinone oxidoreductase subunit L, partial [Nocardioides sp. J9]